jgi:hypothetical protein
MLQSLAPTGPLGPIGPLGLLGPLGHRLAHAAVHGLAMLAAVLVLVGLYAHVLRSAVVRGPLLRPPPHAAPDPTPCEAPPGMICTRLQVAALNDGGRKAP